MIEASSMKIETILDIFMVLNGDNRFYWAFLYPSDIVDIFSSKKDPIMIKSRKVNKIPRAILKDIFT